MKVKIYTEKLEKHNERQVKNAIKMINYAQNYFYLDEEFCEYELTENEDVDYESIKNRVESTIKPDEFKIYITAKSFTDNWFSHEERQFSIISLSDWEVYYAPPSLKTYLVYQIAQALLNFESDISEEMLMRMVHETSKGCIFDLNLNKTDIMIGMIAGVICSECRATLQRYGVHNIAIESIEKILDFVRADAIGRPILTEPNLAFVVMRFSENDENDNAYKYGIKQGLESLGMRVERADNKVTSAQLLDKINRYIDKSRFVIAKVDEDNLNVYFELGLAMGANKNVLLVSEQELVLNLPSDLRNWECLTYPKGNFEELKDRVVKYYKDNFNYS